MPKKNQTSFKKGQSGNPKGPPRTWETFSFVIKKYSVERLEDIESIDLQKIPIKEALVIQQLIKAFKEQNLSTVNWLAERTDGKAKQQTELTGKDGEALQSNTITIQCVDADGNIANTPENLSNTSNK